MTVADSELGLGALARACERTSISSCWHYGSNGKTTVKEMLSAIMSRYMTTLVTQGNLNNELGVPLTLSRLDGHIRRLSSRWGPLELVIFDIWQRSLNRRLGYHQCAPAHLEVQLY